MELNKIYNMDCLEGMNNLPDDSVDLIVSDPPYQLCSIEKQGFHRKGKGEESPFNRYGKYQKQAKSGFMGKNWDVLPETSTLKECLRVLKAGAFSFWLMTPRQDSQSEFITRLKKAGFIISFTPIYWTYLSGFPKASNISKMVDKRLGVEREITGKEKHFGKTNSGIYGFNKNGLKEWNTKNIPSSSQAKALDGSYAGFQPKPAVEVIIVAMKPLSEKSYIEQALKNRKGITWLDDCRIPYDSKEDYESAKYGGYEGEYIDHIEQKYGIKGQGKNINANIDGRFPANLLISDNSVDDGKTRVGKRKLMGSGVENVKPANVYGKYQDIQSVRGYDDSGSLSRYFDLDKWFEKRMPKEIKATFPFMFIPKPSNSEKQKDLNDCFSIEERQMDCDSRTWSNKETAERKEVGKNIHPTVKPIKLFSYLIQLGSRKGDLCLDPYIGSGTMGISAILTNRKFIGFEYEKEYYEIAINRIKKYKQQTKLGQFQ